MCGKCYPLANDFQGHDRAPQGEKRPFWRVLDRLSENLYVLSCSYEAHVRYAPLYIHSFPVCTPRKILEATALNKQYRRYEDITNVPYRLRWCRLSRGMTQREAAERLGMSLHAYKNIEAGITRRIPEETVERLARFYDLPVVDLTDEFMQFLQDGQAHRIRTYRKSLGLGKKPFARKLGIPIRSLREWESERKDISYKCWERYFKGRA